MNPKLSPKNSVPISLIFLAFLVAILIFLASRPKTIHASIQDIEFLGYSFDETITNLIRMRACQTFWDYEVGQDANITMDVSNILANIEHIDYRIGLEGKKEGTLFYYEVNNIQGYSFCGSYFVPKSNQYSDQMKYISDISDVLENVSDNISNSVLTGESEPFRFSLKNIVARYKTAVSNSNVSILPVTERPNPKSVSNQLKNTYKFRFFGMYKKEVKFLDDLAIKMRAADALINKNISDTQ